MNTTLENILLEIEKKQVDPGKFYVGLQAFSDDSEVIDNGWSLPIDTLPGEWREIDSTNLDLTNVFDLLKMIKLYTLSGMLKTPKLIENKLFLAEKSGVSIAISSEYFKGPKDPADPYFRNVNQGVRTTKARLIKEVKSWNQTNIHMFAHDCAKHAVSTTEEVHNRVISIYRTGLEFYKIYGEYSQNHDDTTPIKAYLKTSNLSRQDLFKLWNHELEKIKSDVEKESRGLDHSGNALLACLNSIHSPIYALRETLAHARVNSAVKGFVELKYNRGFNVPSWTSQEKNELKDRIWYLYQKKELDWQVSHLANILKA